MFSNSFGILCFLFVVVSKVICAADDQQHHHHHHFRLGKILRDTDNYKDDAETYSGLVETKWFRQNLDHFQPSDNRKWKQRYFTLSKFSDKKGPIFLEIGGEGNFIFLYVILNFYLILSILKGQSMKKNLKLVSCFYKIYTYRYQIYILHLKLGYMADNLAKAFKAYSIQLEHRFYGKSQPKE